MRCHEINELLSAYFDGLLEPSVQNSVDLHLEGCAACRTELEELAMVAGLVRNLPLVEPPVEFGKELRSKLENLKSPGRSPGLLKKLLLGRWSTVAALAASFLLVFGIAGAWPDLAPRLGVSEQEAGVQSQVAEHILYDANDLYYQNTPEARDESINREKTLSLNSVAPEEKIVQGDRIVAKLPAGVSSRPGQAQNTETAADTSGTAGPGDGGVAARGALPGGHLLMAAPVEGPAERASLNIKADDIGAAIRQISDVARMHGGSVAVLEEEDASQMTVTIPDSQFEKMLDEIGKIGTVTRNEPSAPAPTVTGVYGKGGAEPGITSLQAPKADGDEQLMNKAAREKWPAPAGEQGISLIRIRFE